MRKKIDAYSKIIDDGDFVMSQMDINIQSIIFNLDPFYFKQILNIVHFGNSYIQAR